MRFRELIQEGLESVFYHGTSEADAAYILQHGFGTDHRPRGIHPGLHPDIRRYTFLTPSKAAATWYADNRVSNAYGRHGTGSVITVAYPAKSYAVPGQVDVYSALAHAGEAFEVPLQGREFDTDAIVRTLAEHGYNAIAFRDRSSGGRPALLALEPQLIQVVRSQAIKEAAGDSILSGLPAQKAALLPGLINIMDDRSVAAVLEWDDPDNDALAAAWFDACLSVYQHIAQLGKCSIYRHMMVEDFSAFVRSLRNGTGRLGEYWSIHHGIESPTWKQDQHGDVPVNIEGEIAATQIDWLATLRQNFQWPHESEIIFTGNVRVLRIEDGDTGATVSPKKWYPR